MTQYPVAFFGYPSSPGTVWSVKSEADSCAFLRQDKLCHANGCRGLRVSHLGQTQSHPILRI